MAGHKLTENVAEVGGEGEVAAFVKLLGGEAGPLAIDPAAANLAAHGEHYVGMAVIGAAVAILVRRAAKLGHCDNDDIGHAITHVLIESGKTLTELGQA